MRAAVLSLLLVSLSAYAQPADTRPAFEVASLKAATVEELRVMGGPRPSGPGRWTCIAWSLDNILLNAYQIRAYQLTAPEWVRSAKFTIVGTMPADTTPEQSHLMLQRLVEERFHMALHHEQKEMAVYELVVAKSGAKLTDTTGQALTPVPTSASPAKVDADGFPIIANGSGWNVANGRARIQFRQQTMDNFAYVLGARVDRPVLNATGLTGKYALTLSWYDSPDAGGPDIFKALQDQLGLKLEPKRSQVDMLVIDRADKTPTEN